MKKSERRKRWPRREWGEGRGKKNLFLLPLRLRSASLRRLAHRFALRSRGFAAHRFSRLPNLLERQATLAARTNILKLSFVPRTIRDWNNLPHNVVEIMDDAKFRKLLLFMIL